MGERQPIKAHYRITRWEESNYHEADGLRLARASYDKHYSGEVEGVSTTECLLSYAPDGSSSYVGLEHFRGTVLGRAGALAILCEGVYREGVAETRGRVVSSGGALLGTQGEVPDRAGHSDEHPITFFLELP